MIDTAVLTRFAKLFELMLINRLVRHTDDGGRLYRIQEVRPDGTVQIMPWPSSAFTEPVIADPGELETG